MTRNLFHGAVQNRTTHSHFSTGLFRRILGAALGVGLAFGAVTASAQTSILNHLSSPCKSLPSVGSDSRRQPVRDRVRPGWLSDQRAAEARRHPGFKLQQRQQPPGHGNDHRAVPRRPQQSLFFQDANTPGLSTGLGVLKAGYVLVASMPTSDGTSNTVKPGSLMAINSKGQVVWTLTGKQYIDGPWDMTVYDQGNKATIFVSNVLNGTINRIEIGISHGAISLLNSTTISSAYGHRGDPAALEVGPTGLAYDPVRDTLYVAASFENAIYAIPDATQVAANGGKGFRIYADNLHLHGALALTLAPNGNLICSNSDVINSVPAQPSELVEFTRGGVFVANHSVDPNQGGSFGLAFGLVNGVETFAAVDDNTSSLQVFTIQ